MDWQAGRRFSTRHIWTFASRVSNTSLRAEDYKQQRRDQTEKWKSQREKTVERHGTRIASPLKRRSEGGCDARSRIRRVPGLS